MTAGPQVREGVEDKLDKDSKVISVIRYFPETFSLAEEHLEVTLQTTYPSVRRTLSASASASLPLSLSVCLCVCVSVCLCVCV